VAIAYANHEHIQHVWNISQPLLPPLFSLWIIQLHVIAQVISAESTIGLFFLLPQTIDWLHSNKNWVLFCSSSKIMINFIDLSLLIDVITMNQLYKPIRTVYFANHFTVERLMTKGLFF
jgi:hypothetical protein